MPGYVSDLVLEVIPAFSPDLYCAKPPTDTLFGPPRGCPGLLVATLMSSYLVVI